MASTSTLRSCLDPVSHNSNETTLNGNSRHMASGLTIPERASQLFQNAEILAPMVRASTTPLRSLALSYGCDLVYSEEIIDRAITSTERVYNEKTGTIDYRKKMESFSAKVKRRMAKNNDPLPTVIRIDPQLERNKLIFQMGTGEPNLALPAAMMVQNDVDGIDINMGCPKKFSVSGGMGSALLEDLPRACDVISTLCRNVSVPVSCKIRLLKDDRKTVDFVTALVKAGASAVAIHGREVGDEAQQAAQLDRLVEVVKLLKSSSIGVPIIINGDMYTRNDIVNLRNRSGADAVMLARPALYNTSIFRKPPTNVIDQVNESSQEEETRYGYDSKLLLSKTKVIQDYLVHANTYDGHAKNIKYVVCEMMTNRRTPTNLSPFMPTKFSGGQTIDDVCKCRSMESLCKIWDVSRSAIVSNANASEADGGKESVGAVDMHTYDDRYFLDPEALRKEREAKEAGSGSGKETEKESKCDDKSIAEDERVHVAKKSRIE
jgi:tRNA-dihydrouridine synthase 2